MIAASLYIVVCSARNRLRRRLKRLREPRYLIGSLVGALYLYLAIFGRARGRSAGSAAQRRAVARSGVAAINAALLAAAPALGGLALLALSVVAWVVPFDSGLLDFSDAETDILFPAPITRRQLLVHRLLRSQLGILFASVIVSFVSLTSTGWMRVRMSIALWVVFVTMRVYFTIVSLTRNRVAAAGGLKRIVALTPALIVTGVAAVVSGALAGTFLRRPATSVPEALARVSAVALSGVPGIALAPFVALARPVFAPTPGLFVRALGGALAVGTVMVAWMLRLDEAVQEAAAAASTRRAQKAQLRHVAVMRARTAGLPLATAGRPEPALFWKNGVQTLRLTGLTLVRILIATVAIVIAASSALLNAFHLRGPAAGACAISMAVAAFVAFLGPQLVRTDLRSDLTHIDLLKTWPIPPGAIIRGEIAWPGTMLTVAGWIAIVSAAIFSTAAFPLVQPATRAAVAGAALALMPAVVFAQYLVQNAAAVLFPAWVPIGQQRPRGVDAIGQRLILLAGVLLSLVVFLLPGAVAGGIVWFAFRPWAGTLILVPAAIVCTAVAAVEVLACSELLGPLFDRLDALSVERPE